MIKSQTLAPLGRLHARGQAEDPVRSLFWLRPDMSRGSQEKTFLLGRYQLARLYPVRANSAQCCGSRNAPRAWSRMASC